ncbi:pirin family protein [Embleya sp. NPDC020630]|uniref:pirin family protein n=1 Tax=Embleya sp. NPDC020630 TaxID=3363979 RepID=UPI0037BD1DCD
MSNLDTRPTLTTCGGRADVSGEPVRELLKSRDVLLGESHMVRRLLPSLGRRMIGAWCFVDHYGPDDIADQPGMQVPPHPHLGLQTVSWLREGTVLHRDSLGSLATVRPGELGLMTSGRAISHSEESPREHARLLHGAQLWVALPDAHRHVDPSFEHHTELPQATGGGLTATVIMGTLDGATSPGTAYTPLVGADLTLAPGTDVRPPLEPDFEYAVMSMSGEAEVDGVPLTPGGLLYLGCGRTSLAIRSTNGADLMLLGGEPFAEEIVMWWNFVARTGEEIATARTAWENGSDFGTVTGYAAPRMHAPELPSVPLRARGRVR